VLADVRACDAVITDPPYSERTHAKQRHGRRGVGYRDGWVTSAGLGYGGLDARGCMEIAAWACRVSAGWVCAMTDSDLALKWRTALCPAGRYSFAPLALVMPGMNVRLAGDGPSSWTVWLVVSRPAALHKWGTLPGAYVCPTEQGPARAKLIPGSKPLRLLRAIIRDYTRPGDLIVDPFAGSGTTLLAARLEGRRAIGAEVDPKAFALAVKRLSAPWTPRLFADQEDAG